LLHLLEKQFCLGLHLEKEKNQEDNDHQQEYDNNSFQAPATFNFFLFYEVIVLRLLINLRYLFTNILNFLLRHEVLLIVFFCGL